MAWNLLLSSDIGLFSLFTILFCVVMPVYIFYFVKRHAADETKSGTAPAHLPNAH